ncbi:MAG: DNA-processing protein DprA [Pseudoclavibacter sp.]
MDIGELGPAPVNELLRRRPAREATAWRRAVENSAISLAAMGRCDDPARIEARFAAIAWSSTVEPGDLDAGELVAAIGAIPAARLVLGAEPVAAIRLALEAVGAVTPLTLLPDRLERAVDRWRPRASLDLFERNVRSGMELGTLVAIPGDRDWPEGLDDLGAGAPHALWIRGERGLADLGVGSRADLAAALVGSRSSSPYGDQVAIEFSAGLAARGSTIVSGGAYGIDIAAHRAAMTDGGTTIAVLAGGVDRLYPVGNADALRRIAASGGAIVGELPCGSAPTRSRFLRRNRLIAAMSVATIVVEAGYRSGALNTAGHAGELGRALGAVPGSIRSATSAGCHRLIREFDAALVSNLANAIELVHGAFEVQPELEGLDGFANVGGVGETGGLDGDTARVWEALQPRRGQSAHDLARRAGLSEASVRGALAMLELEGRALDAGGAWRRAGDAAR